MNALADWLRQLPDAPDPALAELIARGARRAVELVAHAADRDALARLQDAVAGLQHHPATGSRYGGRLLADIVVRAADLAGTGTAREMFLARWQDDALQLTAPASLTAAGPR